MPSCKARGDKHNPSFITKQTKEGWGRQGETQQQTDQAYLRQKWRHGNRLLSNCDVPPFLRVATVTTGNRSERETVLEKMREIFWEEVKARKGERDDSGKEAERNN